MQRLMPFQYSWAQAAADVNRDGQMDIISPPFIFMGPDYVTAREFYAGETLNPSTVYPAIMVGFAGDFTGDGWPDFLSTNGGKLYVNPKGEPRRWDVYPNVVTGVSEICVMKDIDGDGVADLVHVGPNGRCAIRSPIPRTRPVRGCRPRSASRVRPAATGLAPGTSTVTAEPTSSMPTGGGSSRPRGRTSCGRIIRRPSHAGRDAPLKVAPR